MKQIILILLISLGHTQILDPIDIQMQNLEVIVQNASRNAQKVFVEDFTGLQ